MPDLPTLTVTDAQAQRMLAAYGSVANYKAWLRAQIIDYVLIDERLKIEASQRKDKQAQLDALRDELGGSP